eukprot:g4001.t1
MFRECTALEESPLHPSDSIDQFSFKCKNINFEAKQQLGSGTFGMVLEYSIISVTPDQGKEDSPIGQSVAIKIFKENEYAEIERTASEYVYKAFCEKEPVTRPWSGETEKKKKKNHHHLSSSMIPSFAISIDGFGTAIIMPQAMKSLEKEMPLLGIQQPEGQSGQQQYLITEFVNKRAALLGLPIAPTFVDEYVDYLRLRIGIDIFRDVLEQLQQISKKCDECAYTDLKPENIVIMDDGAVMLADIGSMLPNDVQLEYGHDRLHNHWSLVEERDHQKELSEALTSSFDRIGAFKVPPKLNGVNVENLKKLVSYDTFERPDVLAEGFNLDIFLMVKACTELPSEVGG